MKCQNSKTTDMVSFLESLTDKEVRTVGRLLSRWRSNGVFWKVMFRADWEISKVDISRILIGGINDGIHPLIHENNHLLETMIGDPRGKMRNKLFVALRVGELFKIIDGSHRIVRLACDGDFYEDTSFLLLHASEDADRPLGKLIIWIKKKLGIYNPLKVRI
jgi:hypothetical protein